jgi:hypothetical protein
VNISVALLQHTRGTEHECWCINVTTAVKELILSPGSAGIQTDVSMKLLLNCDQQLRKCINIYYLALIAMLPLNCKY